MPLVCLDGVSDFLFSLFIVICNISAISQRIKIKFTMPDQKYCQITSKVIAKLIELKSYLRVRRVSTCLTSLYMFDMLVHV